MARGLFATRVADAGLTLSELSRRSGVFRSLVSEYGLGRQIPTPANAAKLAPVLGTTAENIFVDCLSDKWAMGALAAPPALWEGKKSPAARALNAMRELAATDGVSDDFRKQVERAGALVLEAVAGELRTDEARKLRRPRKTR